MMKIYQQAKTQVKPPSVQKYSSHPVGKLKNCSQLMSSKSEKEGRSRIYHPTTKIRKNQLIACLGFLSSIFSRFTLLESLKVSGLRVIMNYQLVFETCARDLGE